MPKLKPHKGARKRFRVTRSGKVLAQSAYTGHLRAAKSAKRKRHLRRGTQLNKPDAQRIKRLLGLR